MQNKTFTFGGQGAPQQQQYQQQAAPQLSVAGWIEAAEQKQAGNGTPFWKLTIAGRTYNAWPECPVDHVDVGQYVQATYIEKPNPRGGAPVKNLRSIQAMQPPAGAPPFNPQAAQQGGYRGGGGQQQGGDSREAYWENRALRDNEKDLHIRREACWNIANALIANAISSKLVTFKDATELRSITQTIVHDIELDVTRADTFAPAGGSETIKQPAPRGDGPIEEDLVE